MRKHILFVLLSLFIGSQMAVAQDHVTNIRAKQQDKMVTITYDLNVRSDVRLFISIDVEFHLGFLFVKNHGDVMVVPKESVYLMIEIDPRGNELQFSH